MSAARRGPVLAVAAATLLAACGGGDERPSSSADASRPHVVVVDGGVATDLPALQPYAVRQVGGRVHSDHGTMMLSVVLGLTGQDPIEPGSVDVTSVVVSTGGREDALAEAIARALDVEPDVVSVSMGVRRGTPALAAVVDRAREAGVVVVAAAGNVRFLPPDFPARYDSVLAVGAQDAEGQLWPGSAQDGFDVAAIGVDVEVLRPDGAVTRETGTSVAAAAVTHDILRQLVDGVIDEAGAYVAAVPG